MDPNTLIDGPGRLDLRQISEGLSLLVEIGLSSEVLDMEVRCLVSNGVVHRNAGCTLGAWRTFSLRDARILQPCQRSECRYGDEYVTTTLRAAAWAGLVSAHPLALGPEAARDPHSIVAVLDALGWVEELDLEPSVREALQVRAREQHQRLEEFCSSSAVKEQLLEDLLRDWSPGEHETGREEMYLLLPRLGEDLRWMVKHLELFTRVYRVASSPSADLLVLPRAALEDVKWRLPRGHSYMPGGEDSPEVVEMAVGLFTPRGEGPMAEAEAAFAAARLM